MREPNPIKEAQVKARLAKEALARYAEARAAATGWSAYRLGLLSGIVAGGALGFFVRSIVEALT